MSPDVSYSRPEELFALPPEVEELKLLARSVVDRECIPRESAFLANDPGGVSAADVPGGGESIIDGSLPRDVWDRLLRISQETGIFSATLPEEHGGLGLGVLGSFVLQEELNRSIVPLPRPNVPAILYSCTEDQRAEFLDPVLAGERWFAFAQTEPGAGSDPGAMTTRAVLDGDEWVIDGAKTFISLADKAAFHLCLAVTDPTLRQRGGITLFLVPSDTPGITIAPLRTWQSATPHQFSVFYDSVRIPRGNVLGEVGGGFALGQQWLAINDRLTRGAMATGFLSRCMDMAVDWVRTRHTFGAPLAERQAIQWMLVDVLLDLKSIRAVSYECAARADAGDDVRAAAAMAKLMGANWGHRSLDKIMQIFGGMGEATDGPIPHWYHVLRHGRIGGGTDEIQRILISRAILRGDRALWQA
jgi:acyl-CoA dehydrogenase